MNELVAYHETREALGCDYYTWPADVVDRVKGQIEEGENLREALALVWRQEEAQLQ